MSIILADLVEDDERKSDITASPCLNGLMLPPMVDFAARNTPIRPADRLGAALGLPAGTLWFARSRRRLAGQGTSRQASSARRGCTRPGPCVSTPVGAARANR
ncbi:MAG: hypothetical protein R2710_16160 [Acidimicrobiales bacterium]